MLTVTELARKCHISRASVLFYERKGLLKPALRSENGYRWYGEAELDRLNKIISYRSYGIPVAEISILVDRDNAELQSELLQAQFHKLEQSISALRKQQSAIVALLQKPELMENKMVTKQRWVEIMQASGFSESDMIKWH